MTFCCPLSHRALGGYGNIEYNTVHSANNGILVADASLTMIENKVGFENGTASCFSLPALTGTCLSVHGYVSRIGFQQEQVVVESQGLMSH